MRENDGDNNEINYLTGNPPFQEMQKRIAAFKTLLAARSWHSQIPEMNEVELELHHNAIKDLNVGGYMAPKEEDLLKAALQAHLKWRRGG